MQLQHKVTLYFCSKNFITSRQIQKIHSYAKKNYYKKKIHTDYNYVIQFTKSIWYNLHKLIFLVYGTIYITFGNRAYPWTCVDE